MTSTVQCPRLSKAREVLAMTTLSRTHLYRLIRQGDFPSAFKITPGRVVWLTEDVDKWVAQRVQAAAEERAHVAR